MAEKSYHVYVWWRGETPIYVGASANPRRRFDHLAPSQTQDGSAKARYFREHRRDLRSVIVLDNLSRRAALIHEARLIDRYGLARDGSGTLLNERRQDWVLRQMLEKLREEASKLRIELMQEQIEHGRTKSDRDEAYRNPLTVWQANPQDAAARLAHDNHARAGAIMRALAALLGFVIVPEGSIAGIASQAPRAVEAIEAQTRAIAKQTRITARTRKGAR